MADDLSLLFRVKADSSQAKRELSEVRQVVAKELKAVDAAADSTTGSAGKLGGAFSGLLSPANLLAGAGLAAAGALLALGKQAFDAAGELFDLHQKTGFAVETLSALKLAGETSGASIQSLSSALGLFEKNMVAAEGGNKKLAAAFKDLNISTTDHEVALRQAFRALNQMAEGEEQTALAMQLFGRSGKDVLAVIKEMGGDLDGAIAKFREMGVLIDTETAQAADQMGDSLTSLGQAAKGAAIDLVKALGPALEAIITILKVAIEVLRVFISLLNEATDPANVFPIVAEAKRLKAINEGTWGEEKGDWGEEERPKQGLGGMLSAWEGIRRRSRRTTGGGGGGGGRVSVPRAERTPDDYGQDLVGNLQSQVTLLMASEDAAGKAAAAIKNLEREHGKLSEAVKSSIQEGYRLIEVEEKQKRLAELQSKQQEALRKTLADQKKSVEELGGGWKSSYEILEEQIVATQRMNIEIDEATLTNARLNAILLTGAEMWKRIKLEMSDVRDIFGEMAALQPLTGAGLGQAILDDMGGALPPVMDTFKSFGEQIADIFAKMSAQAGNWGTILTGVMGSVGNAVGQVVKNFVLFGAAGMSFRKFVAEVLAGVAAEAAVKAVFELAEGFAMLFLHPTKAAAHFKAAALYGSIAGVAAVAGRAVAGNAFRDEGKAAATGSTSTAGGGNSTASTGPNVITQERPREQVIRLIVESNDSHIIKTWVDDFRRNGNTRVVVEGGGVLAA